jgi:hypothetical protein
MKPLFILLLVLAGCARPEPYPGYWKEEKYFQEHGFTPEQIQQIIDTSTRLRKQIGKPPP